MKHIAYTFSNDDIEAVSFALSLLPSLRLEKNEVQADINYQLCCSALKKLSERSSEFLPNEFRVIFAAVQAVQLINQGVLDADAATKKTCARYLFTVNKLVSMFDVNFS